MSTPRLYRLPSSSHRNSAAGIFVGSLVGVVGGLVLVLWAGTQWAAWKLSYQAGLARNKDAITRTLARNWSLSGP